MKNNTIKINGEQVFSVPNRNFAISASSSGYKLQWSIDGIAWSDADSVDASTNWVVTNAPIGVFFKLDDNTDEVTICY